MSLSSENWSVTWSTSGFVRLFVDLQRKSCSSAIFARSNPLKLLMLPYARNNCTTVCILVKCIFFLGIRRCLFWKSYKNFWDKHTASIFRKHWLPWLAFLLKNKRPTWCSLLFYFTSYVLNMFRTLIYPSSGACDCAVELPHLSFCSRFVVCWRFGAAGFE